MVSNPIIYVTTFSRGREGKRRRKTGEERTPPSLETNQCLRLLTHIRFTPSIFRASIMNRYQTQLPDLTEQVCVTGGITDTDSAVLPSNQMTQYPYNFRLRNELHCVGWGVKLYSLTHPYNSKVIRFYFAFTVFRLYALPSYIFYIFKHHRPYFVQGAIQICLINQLRLIH